jgi:hypothetical protein
LFHLTNSFSILYDKSLASKTKDTEVKTAAEAVLDAAKKAIARSAACGYKMKNAKGIAIYMPKYSMNSAYKKIALGQTKWVDGINAIIKAYGSSKTAEVAKSVYNMDYPEIVAQAVKLEMERGNFENFETLLNNGDSNALSTLKKELGTDLLKGQNLQLKTQFDRIK